MPITEQYSAFLIKTIPCAYSIVFCVIVQQVCCSAPFLRVSSGISTLINGSCHFQHNINIAFSSLTHTIRRWMLLVSDIDVKVGFHSIADMIHQALTATMAHITHAWPKLVVIPLGNCFYMRADDVSRRHDPRIRFILWRPARVLGAPGDQYRQRCLYE